MIYTLPFIAAAIGWFTNYLAVKMLFHPKKPINLLGFTLQGIFPKRQVLIAQKIGKVVADELLTMDDIKKRVVDEKSMNTIYKNVAERMDGFLEEKVGKAMPLVALLTPQRMKDRVRDEILKEVKIQLPKMVDKYMIYVEETLDIEEMISDKFAQLSTDKLETVLNNILAKEFRFIEIIGAIIGFIVGWIQIGLLVLGGNL